MNARDVDADALSVVDVVVRWGGAIIAAERVAPGGRLALAHSATVDVAPDGASACITGADGASVVPIARGVGAVTVDVGALSISVRADRARPRAVESLRERVDARLLRVSGCVLVAQAGFVAALFATTSPAAPDASVLRFTPALSWPHVTEHAAPLASVERPPRSVERARLSAGLVDLFAAHAPRSDVDDDGARDAAVDPLEMIAALGGVELGAPSHALDGGFLTAGLAPPSPRDTQLEARMWGIPSGVGAIDGPASGPHFADAALPPKKAAPVGDDWHRCRYDCIDIDFGPAQVPMELPSVTGCLQDAWSDEPELDARIVLGWTVDPVGIVHDARVVDSTTDTPAGRRLGACMVQTLRATRNARHAPAFGDVRFEHAFSLASQDW